MSKSTIRIQPLDGAWKTLGSDTAQRGMIAESIEAKADHWGPSALTFSVKALPQGERLDLVPRTPVEYEEHGTVVWTGYIWERPSSDNEYQVSCRGWQFHLDDDMFNRVYVHARMADWRDIRGHPGASLGSGDVAASPDVGSDQSGITLMYPKDIPLETSRRCGVFLDLGLGNYAKRVVVGWSASNNDSNAVLFARGLSAPLFGLSDGASIVGDYFQIPNNSGTAGGNAGTVAAGARWLSLFMYYGGGVNTPGADIWFKLTTIRVFRETAYESGFVSALKSDDVAWDAIQQCPQLTKDASKIADGSFFIPDYLTGGYKTPRQVIEESNVYENYRTRIGGADLKTVIIDPKPSAPLFEIGEWSGAKFTDASVSGEEIYSKGIVEASSDDSNQVVAIRGHGHTSVRKIIRASSAGNIGPGGGVITSFGSVPSSAGGFMFKGIPYAVRWRIVRTSGDLAGTGATVRLGYFSGSTPIDTILAGVNVSWPTGGDPWSPWLTWVPDANRNAIGGQFDAPNAATTGTARLEMEFAWGATPLERRGLPRAQTIEVRTAVTQLVGERFAELWLEEHRVSPFSASVDLNGDRAVRRVIGGANIPAHSMLLAAGEKLRVSNRLDPDTGHWGRDGRIAGVTYRPRDKSLRIDLDDRRQDFQRLLERYGALVGPR